MQKSAPDVALDRASLNHEDAIRKQAGSLVKEKKLK
jgi:hypothetical protein